MRRAGEPGALCHADRTARRSGGGERPQTAPARPWHSRRRHPGAGEGSDEADAAAREQSLPDRRGGRSAALRGCLVSRPVARGRDAYRWFMTIATRWADNDAYGHVNNTVYYQWFDTAVNAWLVEAELLDIERGDPIGLVVETGCSYFSALSFPGDVEVGIAVERLGSSSVTYRIGVFGTGEGEPSAQGHVPAFYVRREE